MSPCTIVPCLNLAQLELYDLVAANQTAVVAWQYTLEEFNLSYEVD